jgi:voltage-gated potassium channel Kch
MSGFDVIEERLQVLEVIAAFSALEEVNCVLVMLEIWRAFEWGSWAEGAWRKRLVYSVLVVFEKIPGSKPSRAFFARVTMLQVIMFNAILKVLRSVGAVCTIEWVDQFPVLLEIFLCEKGYGTLGAFESVELLVMLLQGDFVAKQ